MTEAKSVPSSIRFTAEDKKILRALGAKLGLGTPQVLRLAIRKLAEIEQVGRRYVKGAVPVWQVAAELGEQVSEDTWANVPTDLSKNVDHYLYGSPKDEE
jgi:hypothetical protein